MAYNRNEAISYMLTPANWAWPSEVWAIANTGVPFIPKDRMNEFQATTEAERQNMTTSYRRFRLEHPGWSKPRLEAEYYALRDDDRWQLGETKINIF